MSVKCIREVKFLEITNDFQIFSSRIFPELLWNLKPDIFRNPVIFCPNKTQIPVFFHLEWVINPEFFLEWNLYLNVYCVTNETQIPVFFSRSQIKPEYRNE